MCDALITAGATNRDAQTGGQTGQYLETAAEEEEKNPNKTGTTSRSKSRSDDKKDRMVRDTSLLFSENFFHSLLYYVTNSLFTPTP